ncbi:MAG: glutaminyl-peptide cyclotransferase, partial [Dehalococcoidia bacterium]|nr:glutaminyl-peptide cyclotransferase [Dehalococcoidia bacterium]
KVRLDTGEVLQQHGLAADLFGEGIAVYGDNRDRIVQLTWRNHTGFVYDKNTFQSLRTFSYPTEGWGITYDGRRLIMSDGTATLRFLDPDTLAETGSVQVYDGNGPVAMLNELEYVEGTIYANVWLTDRIVMISPDTGAVVGRIDLKGLVDSLGTANHDVLNGIAYDPAGKRLFVTGKLWPKLFEIKLVLQK